MALFGAQFFQTQIKYEAHHLKRRMDFLMWKSLQSSAVTQFAQLIVLSLSLSLSLSFSTFKIPTHINF